MEARYILESSGRAMLETCLNSTEDTFHVRFGFFTQSSDGFDGTTQALYEHMAGDLSENECEELRNAASAHDLRRMSRTSVPTTHLADTELKKQVREVADQISQGVLRRLKGMRRSLDFE